MIVWYFFIGLVIAFIGSNIRANTWKTTVLYEWQKGWALWLLGILFWPLGLDLLLIHNGPSDYGFARGKR